MEEINNFTTLDEDKDDGDAIFLTYKGNEECNKNVWYLDSGANNHMCGQKELFTDLNDKANGEVTFGDSSKTLIKGKGTIMIVLKNGDKKYINDIYLYISVP